MALVQPAQGAADETTFTGNSAPSPESPTPKARLQVGGGSRLQRPAGSHGMQGRAKSWRRVANNAHKVAVYGETERKNEERL